MLMDQAADRLAELQAELEIHIAMQTILFEKLAKKTIK